MMEQVYLPDWHDIDALFILCHRLSKTAQTVSLACVQSGILPLGDLRHAVPA